VVFPLELNTTNYRMDDTVDLALTKEEIDDLIVQCEENIRDFEELIASHYESIGNEHKKIKELMLMRSAAETDLIPVRSSNTLELYRKYGSLRQEIKVPNPKERAPQSMKSLKDAQKKMQLWLDSLDKTPPPKTPTTPRYSRKNKNTFIKYRSKSSGKGLRRSRKSKSVANIKLGRDPK
jgi:hypothetical protein